MAWSSLNTVETELGWQTIALPSVGPLPLRAGRRSPDNAEAVLVGFPSAYPAGTYKLPEGQGFSVERVDTEGSDSRWLALTRKPAGSVDLFMTMACDVVEVLEHAVATGADEARLMRAFIERVGAWQEFMRKGPLALSPEAEIGLIGELITLLMIIDEDVPPGLAIESWVGPLGRIQDFELGTGALEVKTTLCAVGFPAKISSLDQLDDSTRQPLFMVGIRLKQTTSGKSLPDVVEALRTTINDDIEPQRLLTDRLLAAGYIDSHADHYSRRFEQIGIRVVEVGESFPRLTSGRVPAGVNKAMYEIDLDKTPGENIAIASTLKILRTI